MIPADDPSPDAEVLDLIRLTRVPGVGPRTCEAVLDHFGSAARVLAATERMLREVPGVGGKLASKIAQAHADRDAEADLALCRELGVGILARKSRQYPASLAEIPDPPSLLYARGSIEPVDHLAIAIVGSRRCTPYGIRAAERLASGLARVGLTIISGLARGIDAAAHRGALAAGGRTIAVLANGLAEVYPPEHDGLAREVAAAGAVVSETPMRQGPLAELFPRRNRIISGLSLGVIVVEATPRSGSLSTARHAEEQNRQVYAVPGPIDSLPSRGCHALIRDGATLVEGVDDVIAQLGPLIQKVQPAPDRPAVAHPVELTLSDQERALLAHIQGEPVPVDALIAATRLTAAQVMATLSVLEMRRLIRRQPGPAFVRA